MAQDPTSRPPPLPSSGASSVGLASQALSGWTAARILSYSLPPNPIPPDLLSSCPSLGLCVRPPCPHKSRALPRPRSHGQSWGCHLACHFSSCNSSCHAIPTSHLPPPKTRLQVGLSSAPWRRQSAEELDGRGRRVTLDRRSFRMVTLRLTPALCRLIPSWSGQKPSSRILRGTGPRTHHPSTLQLQNRQTRMEVASLRGPSKGQGENAGQGTSLSNRLRAPMTFAYLPPP
ncbi:uncharacterized protein LOC130851995 [Hippopotamus amphibius kiboko]|uniref:uncharacterized protein LOC130851995 n=1 Tax=Hippopotamus amphibius kiboko TaxID=575201 RepID=UPI0025938EE1|nr:uncharacterized protein LOC130851995 [Hippopotamus amphibius kiboko]